MGSIITFGIDKFEIEWGKNGISFNHSIFYNKDDIKKEYYYYADNYKEKKDAFSKNLFEIKDVLELLGYSLKNIKKEFGIYCEWYNEYCYSKAPINYKNFHNILLNIEPEKIKFTEDDEYSSYLGFFKYFRYCIKDKLKLNNDNFEYGDEEFYANIDPYIVLRILIENPKNHNRSVIWRFHDVLEGGYIKEKDLFEDVDNNQKFLIVTEGSSDTNIIKKSLQLLNSEVIKFFSFIDMKENYPFTGTGNLYNFIKGLSKINIINKVLIIFDNDAEGCDKYNKCRQELKLPSNIRVTKLPDLKHFNKFKTIGPFGSKLQNINGKAVSIECFLDLTYKNEKDIITRWKNYNEKLNTYQGALQDKEKYTSLFLKIKSPKVNYNFEKLKLLNQFIIRECVKLNEK